MGNTLSNQAGQSLNYDFQINELKGFELIEKIKMNRFLKTLLVNYKIDETYCDQKCISKVFARFGIPDRVVNRYINHIMADLNYLTYFPFINTYYEVYTNDRVCVALRPYMHSNVYDRITTRPYLTGGEKMWFIFQMLKILQHIHPRVVHGDIKLENFLLTSWDFLVLSDFSIPIKPTYLHYDMVNNEFNYFFDSSNRQSCYLAPERLIEKKRSSVFYLETHSEFDSDSTNATPDEYSAIDEKPSPMIDIFSLGCVLYQLMTDGNILFRFTDLLGYSEGRINVDHFKNLILLNISNKQLADMVINMISLDPENRMSAREYLSNNLLFPDSFHLLYNFSIDIAGNQTCAEYVIFGVKNCYGELVKCFENEKKLFKEHPGYLILINLCVSLCVNLKVNIFKKYFFELMLAVSSHVSSDIILNRILPYFVFFFQDSSPIIKNMALSGIIKILKVVKSLESINESNLFSDYILMYVKKLGSDSSVEVRTFLATCFKDFCEEAIRYHYMTYNLLSSGDIESPESLRDSLNCELESIYYALQALSITLLSDSSSLVQVEFIRNSFGSVYHKLNSVFPFEIFQRETIISHAISVLNNNDDWVLRQAFYDILPKIYLTNGKSCLSQILPIMFQGLQDSCEWVVQSTINFAIYLVNNLNSISPTIHDIIKSCHVFMIHPVPSIRRTMVDLIVALKSESDELYFNSHIIAEISPFIRLIDSLSFTNCYKSEYIKTLLIECVPPKIFYSLINRPGSSDFFDYLVDHNQRINSQERLEDENYDNANSDTFSYFIGLLKINNFCSPSNIKSLILMKDHILSCKKEPSLRTIPTYNELLSKKTAIDLSIRHKKNLNYQNFIRLNSCIATQRSKIAQFNIVDMLSETRLNMPSKFCSMLTDLDNRSLAGLNHLDALYATSFKAYKYSQKYTNTYDSSSIDDLTKQSDGSLRLVAKFKPHSSCISRISPLDNTSCFTTAGHDCSVMIWNSDLFDSSNLKLNFNPLYIYNQMSGRISSMRNLHVKDDEQNFHRVACASFDDSDIQIFDFFLNSRSNDKHPFHRCVVDLASDGFVVDLCSSNVYSNPLLLAATLNCSILGYDLREFSCRPNIRFSYNTGGYFTSLECDPFGCWVAAGTSQGRVLLWDYRFPSATINSFQTCNNSSISRLQVNCMDFKKIICSYHDSYTPVCIYTLDSGKKVSSFVLSSNQIVSCTGLQSLNINNSLHIFFTCTDGSIRDWNVDSPKSSSILAKSSKKFINEKTIYSSRGEFSPSIETRESKVIDPQVEGANLNNFDNMGTFFTDSTFIPQNQLLIAGTVDGYVNIYK